MNTYNMAKSLSQNPAFCTLARLGVSLIRKVEPATRAFIESSPSPVVAARELETLMRAPRSGGAGALVKSLAFMRENGLSSYAFDAVMTEQQATLDLSASLPRGMLLASPEEQSAAIRQAIELVDLPTQVAEATKAAQISGGSCNSGLLYGLLGEFFNFVFNIVGALIVGTGQFATPVDEAESIKAAKFAAVSLLATIIAELSGFYACTHHDDLHDEGSDSPQPTSARRLGNKLAANPKFDNLVQTLAGFDIKSIDGLQAINTEDNNAANTLAVVTSAPFTDLANTVSAETAELLNSLSLELAQVDVDILNAGIAEGVRQVLVANPAYLMTHVGSLDAYDKVTAACIGEFLFNLIAMVTTFVSEIITVSAGQNEAVTGGQVQKAAFLSFVKLLDVLSLISNIAAAGIALHLCLE